MKDIKIGITAGDPNGVGYEVIFKSLIDEHVLELCTPIIYGGIEAAKEHLKFLDDDIRKIQLHVVPDAANAKLGCINFVNCFTEVKVQLGQRDTKAGEAARLCLEKAIKDWKSNNISALVTAPICKETIRSEEFPWEGHTEWLENAVKQEGLMMFVSDNLRVGLVTNHLPIAELSEALTPELIEKKLLLLNTTLKNDFGIEKPRIAVLGLNPHAGDGGVIGQEEQSVIIPVVKKLNEEGLMLFGPYAADGFWGSGKYRLFDAVMAMYHDQALIAFKLLDMSGVNMTAGLDIVRTSPDHGTCFDIAGKNMADEMSMRHAIWLAIDTLNKRRQIIPNTQL